MFTVALIGPDGAGKTTVSRRLAKELPLPVKSIYMGVNLDSSSLMLPSTRLILALKRARGRKPDMVAATDRPSDERRRPFVGRAAASAKRGTRLAVWLGEEWLRQLVAWYHAKARRRVVVFDRHFFADYYAYDVAPPTARRPLSSRIHGILLQHAYPKPDLAVFLDAPAAVLYARKPEATVEWLERRREEYVRMRDVLPNFARVDASGPADEVAREVARVIIGFHEARTRREHGPGAPKNSA
jgi:thymidylate kinase